MTLNEAAISYHELWLSLVSAGFLPDDALKLVGVALQTNIILRAAAANG